MSAQHTPGPWHVGGSDKSTIYNKYGQRIANSFEGVLVTQASDETCQANARLIAAAPDLLELLQELVDGMTDVEDSDSRVLFRARAAIAKATGQEGGAA